MSELGATREEAWRLYLLLCEWSHPRQLSGPSDFAAQVNFDHFEQWLASKGIRFAESAESHNNNL